MEGLSALTMLYMSLIALHHLWSVDSGFMRLAFTYLAERETFMRNAEHEHLQHSFVDLGARANHTYRQSFMRELWVQNSSERKLYLI